jgi:HEAT repeat protein
MEVVDTEVRALVGRLNNLHEIFRVQAEILSYGEEIVEPLAALLLSEPSTLPEPRVAAAECLGAIGGDKAVNALIRVLDCYDLRNLGPVQRFAEEMVRNAAARRLPRFRQPQVIEALLASLKRDHLIGAGQALAQLGETRAISYLIQCLEDDYKKEKAMEALRCFGQAAVPYLCEAVERPRFVEGLEPPLSQERRSRAAELLGQLKAQEALPALEAGLHDESETVCIASSVALAGLGIATEEVLCQTIAGLENPDLMVRKDCEEALQQVGGMAVPLLAEVAGGETIHVPRDNEVRLSLSGRLTAIKLLGLIQEAAAVLCLINLLKDPEEIVRYRSVAALQNFAHAQVRAALERVAREDSSRRVRERAREALQMLAKKLASLIQSSCD